MAPKFVRYVSSVEGRLVHRWDAPDSLIGAKYVPEDAREPGDPAVVWDTAKILPLTDEYCRKYVIELRKSISRGDLIERTEADYLAQLTAQPTPTDGESQ